MGLGPNSTNSSLQFRHCWETLMHGGPLSPRQLQSMALACRGIDLEVSSMFACTRSSFDGNWKDLLTMCLCTCIRVYVQ